MADVDADAVKLEIVFGLICILGVACERRERAVAMDTIQPTPTALPSDLSIELERIGYFDSPSYTVTLDASGSVKWDGRRAVEVRGIQSSQIPVEVVRDLVSQFDSIEFRNLHDHYQALASDIDRSRLTLREAGKTKTVIVASASVVKDPDTALWISDDYDPATLGATKRDESEKTLTTPDELKDWQEQLRLNFGPTFVALNQLCGAFDRAVGTSKWIGTSPDEKRR